MKFKVLLKGEIEGESVGDVFRKLGHHCLIQSMGNEPPRLWEPGHTTFVSAVEDYPAFALNPAAQELTKKGGGT
jgi:hypothetical protein